MSMDTHCLWSMVNFKPCMLAVQLHSVDFHFSKAISYLGYVCLGFFQLPGALIASPELDTSGTPCKSWCHPPLEDEMFGIWPMAHKKSPGRKSPSLAILPASAPEFAQHKYIPWTPLLGPYSHITLPCVNQAAFLSLWVKVQLWKVEDI